MIIPLLYTNHKSGLVTNYRGDNMQRPVLYAVILFVCFFVCSYILSLNKPKDYAASKY